jgi:hypothetical protein
MEKAAFMPLRCRRAIAMDGDNTCALTAPVYYRKNEDLTIFLLISHVCY